MTIGPFDHDWLSGLFGDAELSEIWSGDRTLEHMCAFEAAWSRALGAAGLFDAGKAEAAAKSIEAATIDKQMLSKGTAIDGVVVPALVAQLKALSGTDAIHTGATSQDVIDTALAMTLRNTSDVLQARLIRLVEALTELETRFGEQPLQARTRMQAATMMTVGDRVQSWRDPLENHMQRLEQVRPRVERVQIGGASGDRAVIKAKERAIVATIADALKLAPADRAWHNTRDGVAEYASLLSLVTGTLGKVGQDVVLMAQQGVDEITLSGGGGSSAMPHKHNPVAAELLVTLARFNAVQLSGMHQSLVHEQERSGAAWSLEWMILPQMALSAGRSLNLALDICGSVRALGSGIDS